MRPLFNTVACIILTGLWASLAIVLSFVSPSGRLPLWVARNWSRSMLAVSGVSLSVAGREGVDWSRTYLYMSNHRSHFDIPALFAAIPANVRMLAKKELSYIPIFGWSMILAGFVFIDRNKRDKAFASLDRAARDISQKKRSVVVFPEGSRNPEPEQGMKPFKKGGFHLALKAGVEILPVVVLNSEKVMQKHRMAVYPGRIEVRIGRPIDPTAYTGEKAYLNLMADVRAAMEKLLGESSATAPE